jgi:NAD(P)-dependent dehydrogenase (short-subunit alcohol dehydrogenase family)
VTEPEATVGLVTGAASGIGAACVERLVGTVDVLVLADLHLDPVADAAERWSNDDTRCVPVAVDIADRDDVGRLATDLGSHGTLRSVVHAAGLSPTMADWERVMDVDLVGTALLVDAVRPLVTNGSAVVCIASMAAHLIPLEAGSPVVEALDRPLEPGFLADFLAASEGIGSDPGIAYACAKQGVRRLVQREAAAFGAVGARICSVSPGTIDTPMGRRELERQPEMRHMGEVTPLQRPGRAPEVAAVIAFLLSDDASFMTGVDVLVDGGTVAALTTT